MKSNNHLPAGRSKAALPTIAAALGALAVTASAETYTYSGGQNSMNQAQCPVATYDTVDWNITGGYFGISAARSQTYANPNLVFTAVAQNNGWGEAVTRFSSATTVTGSGPFSLITAGLSQDFVFAGNMQAYGGSVSIADAASNGGTTIALGNTGSSVVQYGGESAGGDKALGTVTTDGTGNWIDNVAGSGSITARNVVFNYGTDAAYDYVQVTNAITQNVGVHFIGDADVLVVGAISGAGALNKSGSGTLTLAAANDYTGATNVSAGALVLAGAGTLGGGNVTVAAGATLDVAGAVGGVHTIATDKTLSGAGSIAGTMIMESNAILAPTAGGTLTVENLTFGTADLDLGTINIASLGGYTEDPAVDVTGTLTLNGGPGAVQINLPTGPVDSGTYHLIATDDLADADGFVLGSGPTLNSRQSEELVYNAATDSLDYVVSGENPYWTGATSSEWSTNTIAAPKNWALPGGGTADYIDGDSVLFDDNATGTTVDVSVADVSPTGVVFNNSAKDFTVTGSAAIDGATGLVKNGSGTLTINNANSYYDGTTVNAGTLVLGNAAALGTGAVALNGGTLDLGGQTITNPVTAGGGTLGGSGTVSGLVSGGALVVDATGTVTLTANNAYTGGTTIIGGTLAIGHPQATGPSVTPWGTWSQGFTLRNGAFDMNGQTNYTFAGGQPVWQVAQQAIILGGQAGGVMEVKNSGASAGFCMFALQNCIIYDATNDPGTATISANWYGTGQGGGAGYTKTIEVGDSAATAVELDFTGQMGQTLVRDGNTTVIQKTGAGTMRISAANYFSRLRVTEGTLVVNNANALGTDRTNTLDGLTNVVTVDGGTLDLNGVNCAADELVLTTGSIAGAGTLTVKTLDLQGTVHTSGTFDKTNSNGFITGDGIVKVVGVGFAGWITGTFANGTVPAGLQGPADDPDGDGLDNLMEYAIEGLDPTVADGSAGAMAGTTLTFAKRQPLAADITYAIEESTDLGLTDPWAEVTPTANDDTTISYTLPGGPPKDFMRLKVTQN